MGSDRRRTGRVTVALTLFLINLITIMLSADLLAARTSTNG
jgi:hypothetical protein